MIMKKGGVGLIMIKVAHMMIVMVLRLVVMTVIVMIEIVYVLATAMVR